MWQATEHKGMAVWAQTEQLEAPMQAIKAAKQAGITSFWFVPTAARIAQGGYQIEVWEKQGKFWSCNPYVSF